MRKRADVPKSSPDSRESISSATIKKLSDLTPDTRNANRGTKRGSEMIQASLKEYGAGRSILLDKHGNIIAGNKTAENFGALGHEDVLVVQTNGDQLVAVQRMDLDLAEPKALQLALADNRAGEVSLDWDADVLKELAGEIDLAPFWNKDELADLWPVDLLVDEDEAPPLPVEPVTKVGDLYILGEHRLLCGDSTSAADVERLMNWQKADMVFTDPPYGVKIIAEDGTVGGSLAAARRKGHVDGISSGMKAKPIMSQGTYPPILGDDSTDAALAAYALCKALKIKVMIFWGGNYYADKLPASSAWIVWDKDNGESFFADAELAWTNMKTAVRICKHQWSGLIKASERNQKRVHPTQKPVALAEWCFERYGKPGEGVLDLFGGSGSTLIACEKTRRKCFMMELSPAYCDVIVTRWQNATGGKAVLHGQAS